MSEDFENPETDPNQPHPADVIQALNAENVDLKDRLLRALAETENVRRRGEREREDTKQFAVSRFARDMLGIADNFARALAALPPELLADANPQVRGVIEGIQATERQLMATLAQHGVKPVPTENVKFDPNLHQAIANVPGKGKPAGHVVDVVQTGFTIGDRLLRPAMVTVASEDSGAAPGASVDTTA